MKRTNLPERFQRLLETIPYVTISTVSTAGQPWGTPMVGHFDDDLNLYFLTAVASQHGRNISRNSQIFVTIFDSSLSEKEVEGLYLQMDAKTLETASELQQAYLALRRCFTEDYANHPAFLVDCPCRLYKANPEHIWYDDMAEVDGHVLDVRRELWRKRFNTK